jgi:hypothetical protein
MNGTSNSKNIFFNLTNLHLLWQLFLKTSTWSKKKNTNNTLSNVIEFIANTNNEIQIWIIKICCKLYIHKLKKHKILKVQKTKELKMLKPKQQTKP